MTVPAAHPDVAMPLPPGVTLDDPLVARAVARVGLDPGWIADFCARWKIGALWLFGSVLRDDFRPDSDVDVLVEYLPGRGVMPWSIVRMPAELAAAVGRPVDLVLRHLLENPFRREEILGTARPLYRRA